MDIQGKWGIIKGFGNKYKAVELIKVTAKTTVFKYQGRAFEREQRIRELPVFIAESEAAALKVIGDYNKMCEPYSNDVYEKQQALNKAHAAMREAKAAFWKDLPK